MARPAYRKMVAARGVGLGWFLEKRRENIRIPTRRRRYGSPLGGSPPLIADVSLIKTMWNKVDGQGGQVEERPKKSVSVGTRSVLDGSMNRNKFGSANKAVKVQTPAAGV